MDKQEKTLTFESKHLQILNNFPAKIAWEQNIHDFYHLCILLI